MRFLPKIYIFIGRPEVFPYTNFYLFEEKSSLAILSFILAYSPIKISSKDIFPAHNDLSKDVCGGRSKLWGSVWPPF